MGVQVSVGVGVGRCVAIVCLMGSGSLAAQDPVETGVRDVWADLDERLVALMRAGIETTEPHGRTPNEAADGPPFDGSWDWHSSVIAHWALLVHARTDADDDLRGWVLARLPDEVVELQGAHLRDREEKPRFVFPYDEGWFGLLLAEAARHREESESVRELRIELEGRLLDRLESQAFPENLGLRPAQREAGEVRFCGFYASSLFLYLQLSWCDTVRPDAPERLAAWRRETLEPQRAAITAIDEGFGYDFLWVPALLALVDQLDDDADGTGYRAPAFEDWPDSVTIGEVHVLGREVCRVWPLAAADDGVAGPYVERIESLLRREDLWAEDFKVCSHWMPQYLFIGEWLRAGRP